MNVLQLANNDLFKIGNTTVHVFGIALAIGVVLLGLLYINKLRQMKMDEKLIDKFVIFAGIIGLLTYVCAVFIDGIWHEIGDAELQNRAFNIVNALPGNHSGMTFEGGIICGMGFFALGIELFFKKFRHTSLYFLDILSVGIPLGHTFGRIGCFHAGCCYGKTIDELPNWLKWCTMTYNVPGVGIDQRIPTQLIEAIFVFLLFIVLFFFIKKRKTEFYLISYGIYRFFAEYLRGDNRGASPFGAISPSQFTSFIMIGIGIWCIIWRIMIEKKIKNREIILNNDAVSAYYTNINNKNLFKCLFTKDKCPICEADLKFCYDNIFVNSIIPESILIPSTYCKTCEQKEKEEKNKENNPE